MSKLRCGATQRILPRVLLGIGAWQSSCTHGSAEAEKGLVIRCYKSVVQSTSLLRRPPPLFLFSVRDAAAYSCSDLLKSNKEKCKVSGLGGTEPQRVFGGWAAGQLEKNCGFLAEWRVVGGR